MTNHDELCEKDKEIKELRTRVAELEKSYGYDVVKRLQEQNATLLKASEGMEKALGMVMKANHVDVRKPSEECLKEHFVILLPTEDDDDVKQALADFRAVKETMKKGAGK